MSNLNDVVSGVYARLGSANVTGFSYSEITDLANDALIHLGAAVGTTLGSDSFSSTYMPPVKDLTTGYVVARMMNVNIDTDVRLGNLAISYSSDLQAHKSLIEYYMNRAMESINQMFGGKIAHTITVKVG